MLLSWCGWHMQVLCNFMKMLTWACYEAFGHHGGTKRVPRRRNKNGATATYPKMMPRQHIGSGSSWRYRCKRKCDGSESCKMVGCSRLPGSHGIVAWKRGGTCNDNSDMVQTRASHTTCIRSTNIVSVLYLRSVRFRSGSSRRGSSRSRDGRGSRFVVVRGRR